MSNFRWIKEKDPNGHESYRFYGPGMQGDYPISLDLINDDGANRVMRALARAFDAGRLDKAQEVRKALAL